MRKDDKTWKRNGTEKEWENETRRKKDEGK